MTFRDFKNEIQNITFKKINNWVELINTPTKYIVFSKKDTFGIHNDDVGFITKKRTWIHKHIYYNIHDCVLCGNKVTQETFKSCGYLFYEKQININYKHKTFTTYEKYVDYMLDIKDKN